MIFHDRIPHEHKYIPFVLQMSVLLIHRSSRFNTEDPNTFTGPEFLSLSRDRLSHEPGKCLLKNMLNQQVLQPGTSLEKHRLFPTENPVSTWPCCGRVLDPRPTLMPWRHVKGPMAQLVAKKHAFWTEPKQPKMESGVSCHFHVIVTMWCDIKHWLMTIDDPWFEFWTSFGDREPIFADDQHAWCAKESTWVYCLNGHISDFRRSCEMTQNSAPFKWEMDGHDMAWSMCSRKPVYV